MGLPERPKCLFVTALNSLRESLSKNMKTLRFDSEIITPTNCKAILKSKSTKIFFISPESLKQNCIIQALISVGSDFVIKCIDEVHLFNSWGLKKNGKFKAFRPAMQLSTGELASIGGLTLLQTATCSSKSVRILKEEFPEIDKWNNIINVPFRTNISIIIPPPSDISSKYQVTLEPFVRRMEDFGENHLVLVRSINSGTEVFFHLLSKLSTTLNGKRTVAFYHRNV